MLSRRILISSERSYDINEDRLLASHQLKNQTINRGPAGVHSNCHGWVFAGGNFRLGPDDVQLILTENSYEEVQEPQPGDLVIYRQNGSIVHSALVRYVTQGQPILVEGKWGSLGVMLHATDKSVYGTGYTFYRSTRTGHVLVGLGGQAPTEEARPTIASE